MSKTDNFEQTAKKQLDESLHDLSPEVARRLQQARYTALESVTRKKAWSFYPQAKYAMFALVVVTVSFFINVNEQDSTLATVAMESDIEMLTSNESFELLEDLEFIQWLAETEKYVG